MILVDARVGSRELLPLIRSMGVQAELASLDADFQWTGNGEDGTVLVGVERKDIQDLLNSMRDGRLAGHQMGMMCNSYCALYLVVEGIWRKGRETGLVEVRNGSWVAARGQVKFSETTRFLASLRELAGMRVWRTSDLEETAAYIVEEYHWWQKPWQDHSTGRAIYAPAPEIKRQGHKPTMFRREVSLKEKWLYQLPRIESRVEMFGQHFSSALDVATAPLERWMGIKGVGKKTAEEIVGAISKES